MQFEQEHFVLFWILDLRVAKIFPSARTKMTLYGLIPERDFKESEIINGSHTLIFNEEKNEKSGASVFSIFRRFRRSICYLIEKRTVQIKYK